MPGWVEGRGLGLGGGVALCIKSMEHPETNAALGKLLRKH